MILDKSKEQHTNIYPFVYIRTAIDKHIQIQIHIFKYWRYVLFKSGNAFWHYVWKKSICFFNWVRQTVPNRGTNVRICFLSHVCLAERIFKFRKVISCANPIMWGKFKNFIQIIRINVIDKIVGYSIYALINPLLEGNKFINLNSFSDIWCILSNLDFQTFLGRVITAIQSSHTAAGCINSY